MRDAPEGPSRQVLEAFESSLALLSGPGQQLLRVLEETYSSEWVLEAIWEARARHPDGPVERPLSAVRNALVAWKHEGREEAAQSADKPSSRQPERIERPGEAKPPAATTLGSVLDRYEQRITEGKREGEA